MIMRFGKTAVPYTVSWSSEERHFLAPCTYFGGGIALSQDVSPGIGQPQFGKPHSQRQREAIAHGLCDLCGKSLKLSTKVSLSHARPVAHGADGWAILQVEPMLHKACARESLRFGPSLRRDVERGTLAIRQVTSWRAQCAVMDEIYVETVTGDRRKALGHGKVELLKWVDRDVDWLGA